MNPSQQVTQEQGLPVPGGNLCQGAGAADGYGSGTAGAFGIACVEIYECIMHAVADMACLLRLAQADMACRMDVCIHCWCASAYQ